jgi:Skp family chaperone for outer membrane proteins
MQTQTQTIKQIQTDINSFIEKEYSSEYKYNLLLKRNEFLYKNPQIKTRYCVQK